MRREKCVSCSHVFEYVITREVEGGGHSAFFLNDAGAKETARMRASANLNRALNEAVEPVHCPTCGVYQPVMVRVLREQNGKLCEPNKYASERVVVPLAGAWRAACAANSKDSYTKFMEVWPTHSWWAKNKIREIKYPPYLQYILAHYYWILWAVIIVVLVCAALGVGT
jgi:hypothetical protein